MASASRYTIAVEMAANAPRHASALGVTLAIIGLTLGLRVTSIVPWQTEDTNFSIGEIEMNHWRDDHVICVAICCLNAATTPCAFLSNQQSMLP